VAFFSHILEIMIFTDSLKNNRDFVNVYTSGKSYANKFLVIYTLKNNSDRNRLGISVSKKVGNSVIRHRLKRLIKESYRLHEKMFNSGLDIVVIARKGSDACDFAGIESALLHLMKLNGTLDTVKG
jgi:ribonuclease P protein component